MVPCVFCKRPLDPRSRSIFRQVQGWERRAVDPSRRSGSDITLRERLDVFSCNACIDRLRAGLAVGQTGLALVDDPGDEAA